MTSHAAVALQLKMIVISFWAVISIEILDTNLMNTISCLTAFSLKHILGDPDLNPLKSLVQFILI